MESNSIETNFGDLPIEEQKKLFEEWVDRKDRLSKPIDREVILQAVRNIEEWAGYAYKKGDQVHLALLDLKEACGEDITKERTETEEWNKSLNR